MSNDNNNINDAVKPKKKLTLTLGSVKLDMSRALDKFEQNSRHAPDSSQNQPRHDSPVDNSLYNDNLTSQEVDARMQALQKYKTDGMAQSVIKHSYQREKNEPESFAELPDEPIQNSKSDSVDAAFKAVSTPAQINPSIEQTAAIKAKSIITDKNEKNKSLRKKEGGFVKEEYNSEEMEFENSKKLKKDKLIRKVDIIIEEDEEPIIAEDNIDINEYEILYGRLINVKSAITPSSAPKKFARTKRYGNSSYNKKERIKVDLILGDGITVKDLANKAFINVKSLLKKITHLGIGSKNEDSVIDRDTASLLMLEYGHIVHNEITDFQKIIEGRYNNAGLVIRPPIVAVMGHVDHGKTTLLDNIRNTNIAAKESGGITQHIGAYQIDAPGGKITFFDTPGHQAFFKMRERGSEVTDIIVVVIAADDGIMPQTIEAINHAKNANIPVIIALNKIDKPVNNIVKIKNNLMQHNVVLEEFGGDTILIPISAKTGENIAQLLETILLQAEVNELKSYDIEFAEGTVIETKITSDRGYVATVIIQHGILRKSEIIVIDECYGKIRRMQDCNGKELTEAFASMPVEITGFTSLPQIGQKFYSFKNDNEAKTILKYNIEHNNKLKAAIIKSDKENAIQDIEELFAAHDLKQKTKEITIILKTDTLGSLEAITRMIDNLRHPEINLNIIMAAVGPVLESEIKMAETARAAIIAYNVKIDRSFAALAQKSGVTIHYYQIIYELEQKIKDILSESLAPEIKEEFTGRAQIRQIFPITKTSAVAGCYVTSGYLKVGMIAKVFRNDKLFMETKITSIRYVKEEVKEATNGHECGIKLANSQDLNINDVIETYIITYEKRFIK